MTDLSGELERNNLGQNKMEKQTPISPEINDEVAQKLPWVQEAFHARFPVGRG